MTKPLDLSPYFSESIFEFADGEVNFEHWQRLANQIADLFSAKSVLINQATEKGIEVVASSTNDENPYETRAIVPQDVNIYCHKVIQENTSLVVENAHLDKTWQDNPELTEDGMLAYLGLPLNWPDGRVFGTLCVMDDKAVEQERKLINILESFREVINFELDLIEKNRQLKAVSLLDPLTQLLNRRGLFEAAKNLASVAKRTEQNALVIYMDLDNLKQVNDQFGHDCGDQLIQTAASVIKTSTRGHDISARLGGDEFAIVALVNDMKDSSKVVDRLTRTARNKTIHFEDQSFDLEFSIGIACDDISGDNALQNLLDQADSEMYKNKTERKMARS